MRMIGAPTEEQIDAVAAVLRGKLVEPFNEYEVACLIFDAIGAPI